MDNAMSKNILEFVNHVKPVSKNELEKMHTGSLISRLERLRGLREEFDVSGPGAEFTENRRAEIINTGMIVMKESAIWEEAWTDVKSILSTREHLPRGSKKKRKEAAWAKKHR